MDCLWCAVKLSSTVLHCFAPTHLAAMDPAPSAQAHLVAAVSEEDSGREYKTWKSLPAPPGLEPEQFRGKKGRTLHLFLVRAPCCHVCLPVLTQ
jgi:hypothetical protein